MGPGTLWDAGEGMGLLGSLNAGPEGSTPQAWGQGCWQAAGTSRKIPVASQHLETCGVGGFWPMYHPQKAQSPLGAVMPQSKDH